MTETEKFLSEYKRLETVLRDAGTADSVLDYENEHQTDLSEDTDKLKTCRIIRNYCQHHTDGAKVFPASPEMTKFITRLADRIESRIQHVSDIMVRQKAVTPDMSVKDIFIALSKAKSGIVAVVDKEGYLIGFISDKMMIDLIAKKQSLTGKLSSLIDDVWLKKSIKSTNAGITSPDARAEDIMVSNFDIVVVTKDGKYKGIVSKK